MRPGNPKNRIGRRQAMKLFAAPCLLFPVAALGREIAPPPSCITREGYGTRVTGGPNVEFSYVLDHIVRKIHLVLSKSSPAVVNVEWKVGQKKMAFQTRLRDKLPVSFGTVPARRAVKRAEQQMSRKLIAGYERPERYYVMIHEEPNMATLIKPLASALTAAAIGFRNHGESVDPIRNILAFVQSLPHECNDGIGPQWPTESLLGSAADCDDKTILACALLNAAMRYYEKPPAPWVMIYFPGHLTLGLNSSFCKAWKKGVKGFSYSDQQFIYVEMNAGPNTKVGWIPDEFASRKATIWPHPKLVKTPTGNCRRTFNNREFYFTWKCKG